MTFPKFQMPGAFWSLVCLIAFSTLPSYGTTLYSSTKGPTVEIEAAVAPELRIENLTKIPGTERGFPSEDYFTFSRIGTVVERNASVVMNDENGIRIHNDGNSDLVITQITTTNNSMFGVSGLNTGGGGLTIKPGDFAEGVIKFLAKDGEKRLEKASLLVKTSADSAATEVATLHGAYMVRTEGGNEINLQQVFFAFGFGTEMGRNSNGSFDTSPNSNRVTPEQVLSGSQGDLVLAPTFVAADPSKPVRMFQLAAFHGPERGGFSLRDLRGGRTGVRYFHGTRSYQTLFPRLENGSDELSGDAAMIDVPFYASINNYFSTYGTRGGGRADEFQGVRVYTVIDNKGNVVPNEYILAMDYVGTGCGVGNSNCDWNDHVSYLINARPEGLPTAGSIDDVTVPVLTDFFYDVIDGFEPGFPGNRFTYSAELADGQKLPDWIDLCETSGRFALNAPLDVANVDYDIVVTATGANGTKVATDFTLSVGNLPTGTLTEFWLEAECAEVGDEWRTVQDASVAGGEYVVSDENSSTPPPADASGSQVRFTLFDAQPGTYDLFGRVRADASNNDSFWVRVNGGDWKLWFWRAEDPSGFGWAKVYDAGVRLQDGTNTVDFAFREADTYLDKIYLNATGLTPTGLGVPGTNCGTTSPGLQDNFWLEAECAEVGSDFVIADNMDASLGEMVYVPNTYDVTPPPADLPSNRVSFTVPNARAGSYHLFARVRSFGSTYDSYWVRVNGGDWFLWYWRDTDAGDFAWSEVFQSPFTFTEGRNVIDFAVREPFAYLDKIHLNQTGEMPTSLGALASNCGRSNTEGVPAAGESIWLEAECAEVGDKWVVEKSTAATGCNLVYVPASAESTASSPPADIAANRVRFTVSNLAADNYQLFARVRGDGNSANSFYVRVNDGPWVLYFWTATDPSGLVWARVSNGAFSFDRSVNTIDFSFREPQTYLDKVHLNTTGIVPTGYGGIGDNCGDPEAASTAKSAVTSVGKGTAPSALPFTAAAASLSVYPNPAVDFIRFDLDNNYEGNVTAVLLSVDGRVVSETTFSKMSGAMSDQVSTADLSRGTYVLRLISGRDYEQSIFVKL